MRKSGQEDAVLSREELDALLEEMPKIWAEREADNESKRSSLADIELQRANEAFAFEMGLVLSNRYQRVIGFSLIGQREIEMSELAELMLPTDLVSHYQLLPQGLEGYLLLSRSFFFQLLSMSFGSGPTIKPTRPPTREYSRIERRFYSTASREILEQFEKAWNQVSPGSVAYSGLLSRASVAESLGGHAVLATFDVRGFAESCRVRVAIPSQAFERKEGAPVAKGAGGLPAPKVSVMDVSMRLRAQVGTLELSLAEVSQLRPGSELILDAPSDGSLVLKMGSEDKFRGISGTRGARRAVKISEKIDDVE